MNITKHPGVAVGDGSVVKTGEYSHNYQVEPNEKTENIYCFY